MTTTNKNTQNKKNLRKEAKNRFIISDYEMNERIANNICDIIENEDVQAWKKGWRLPKQFKDKDLQSLDLTPVYELVLQGMAAVNVYSLNFFDFFNGNPLPAGFYVSFKDIKNHQLKLKKGAKGEATYNPRKFDKTLTQDEQLRFEQLLEINEELQQTYQQLVDKEINSFRLTFDYMSTSTNEKRTFDQVVFLKNNVLTYSRFQYVLEYQFHIEDLETKIDVKKLWHIEEKENTTKDKEKTEDELKADRIDYVEEVKEDYIKRANLKFYEIIGDEAFYRPSNHSVTVPLAGQFSSIPEYYQTVFHELAHSTGAKQLLNRTGITRDFGKWGDKVYAKEELVAELSSIYTLTALNVLNDEVFKNSIAYLKSWGSTLKEGIRHNIINTIQHSQKASCLILNIQ